MTEPLARWLRLREPADHAARSDALTRLVESALQPSAIVHVLDLGTGTGSNVRYLTDRLPVRQSWLAVDRDRALLDELPSRTAEWAEGSDCEVRREAGGCSIRRGRLESLVETRQVDLGEPGYLRMIEGRHLVTASALLDLVSAEWLQALAAACRAVGAYALFALTYDGRSSCSPPESEDDSVRALLNRHQLTDKGLGGPAAGPEAMSIAEWCFREEGYFVRHEPSDWMLGPEQRDLQVELIEGWARAASETAPHLGPAISGWRAQRLDHVAAGRSRLTVGHQDLAAFPSPPRT